MSENKSTFFKHHLRSLDNFLKTWLERTWISIWDLEWALSYAF